MADEVDGLLQLIRKYAACQNDGLTKRYFKEYLNIDPTYGNYWQLQAIAIDNALLDTLGQRVWIKISG